MTRMHVRVIGMRGNGLHALAVWLAPKLGRPHLFNNLMTVGPPWMERELSDPAYDQRFFSVELGTGGGKSVLCLYEDVDPDRFSGDGLESDRRRFGLGMAELNVCVVRDFPNMLASRLKKQAGWSGKADLDTVRMWRRYAGILRDGGRVGELEVVPVLFNRWVVDAGYRDGLSSRMGLSGDEVGFGRVLNVGWEGSAFDGVRYDGRAWEMRLEERFRQYRDDGLFRSLMDPEALRLSEELFGRTWDF